MPPGGALSVASWSVFHIWAVNFSLFHVSADDIEGRAGVTSVCVCLVMAGNGARCVQANLDSHIILTVIIIITMEINLADSGQPFRNLSLIMCSICVWCWFLLKEPDNDSVFRLL